MRSFARLLSLLLVIVLLMISFAVLCFASANDATVGTESANAGGTPFRFADTLAMQEPPGDYVLRAASLWPQQRNLPLYRLFELLPVSFLILSSLKWKRTGSNRFDHQKIVSIFMASCHILRAPPTIE